MKRVSIFLMGIVTICCITIFSSSCVNNKKDVLFACDSTNVSYNITTKPLLKNSCNTDGCHNSNDKASGVILDDYSSIITLVDTSNLTDTSYTLANSRLFTVVEQNIMPTNKTGKSLSICDKVKIKKWILLGAQNN